MTEQEALETLKTYARAFYIWGKAMSQIEVEGMTIAESAKAAAKAHEKKVETAIKTLEGNNDVSKNS